jgi:hypothetical protein
MANPLSRALAPVAPGRPLALCYLSAAEMGDKPAPGSKRISRFLLAAKKRGSRAGRISRRGFFIYCEEIDLFYRIQRAGWRIYWVPQAEMVHFGGQSTQQVSTEMFLNLYLSNIKYFRKHHGWLVAQIYKLILRIAVLSRLILTPFVIFEPSSRRRKHLILVDRYWRLILGLTSM